MRLRGTLLLVALGTRGPGPGDTDAQLRDRIRAHVEVLCSRPRSAAPESPDPGSPLDLCLAALAARVDPAGDPALELEAVFWALAYFLDTRDRLPSQPLTANVLEGLETPVQRAARHRAAAGVTLEGRQDLAVHFFAAAALTLRLGPRATSRMALAKELADAQALDRGTGTGFSFADLCAGEAGIRLGVRVKELGAGWTATLPWRMQDLMPGVAGLEEGLTSSALEAEFGGVQGARFQSRMRRIQERVAACNAYRD